MLSNVITVLVSLLIRDRLRRPWRLIGFPVVFTLALLPVGLGVASAQPAFTGTEVTIPLTATTAGVERTYRLAAIEYRPARAGQFPAVVLSHGSNPLAMSNVKE